MRYSASFSVLACAAFLLTSCAAGGAVSGQAASAQVASTGQEAASFERDRQSILAMAGWVMTDRQNKILLNYVAPGAVT